MVVRRRIKSHIARKLRGVRIVDETLILINHSQTYSEFLRDLHMIPNRERMLRLLPWTPPRIYTCGIHLLDIVERAAVTEHRLENHLKKVRSGSYPTENIAISEPISSKSIEKFLALMRITLNKYHLVLRPDTCGRHLPALEFG